MVLSFGNVCLPCCSKAISGNVSAEHLCVYRRQDNDGDWRRDNGRKLEQNSVGKVLCDAVGDCNDGR